MPDVGLPPDSGGTADIPQPRLGADPDIRLDETAIEADAFVRCCGKLAAVEQSEAAHASRRAKVLPNLAFHREMVARQSQQETNLALEDERVARIEHGVARIAHVKESEDSGH